MNPSDSALVAVTATAALVLVNRGVRRFGLSFEARLWFLLAWGLILVAVMLVVRALGV